MPIDREALKKQLERSKEERGSFGAVTYLKTGKIRLRVLEFEAVSAPENCCPDVEGGRFARKYAEWRKPTKGDKWFEIDRRTFGRDIPDAYAQLEAVAEKTGEEFPFRHRRQFLIKAIDVDATPFEVKTYMVPTTVWDAMGELLISEQWGDILDLDTGHPVIITKFGSGLDTEYTCQPDRKPWPVPKHLSASVKDPILDLVDKGLERQLAHLGVDGAVLFEGEQEFKALENVEPVKPKESKPRKHAAESKPSAPAPAPEPASTGTDLDVGDRVVVTGLGSGILLSYNVKKDEFVVKLDSGTKTLVEGKDVAKEETEPEPAKTPAKDEPSKSGSVLASILKNRK